VGEHGAPAATLIQLGGELPTVPQGRSKRNEGSHHENAHVNSLRAIQDRRGHHCTVFSESHANLSRHCDRERRIGFGCHECECALAVIISAADKLTRLFRNTPREVDPHRVC